MNWMGGGEVSVNAGTLEGLEGWSLQDRRVESCILVSHFYCPLTTGSMAAAIHVVYSFVWYSYMIYGYIATLLVTFITSSKWLIMTSLPFLQKTREI